MKNTIYFLLFIATLSSCTPTTSPGLTIAAAANMGPSMQEIIQAFEAKYQEPTTLVLNSSGKLSSQIQAGAPYHLFLSADMDYPQRLFEEGLATEAPIPYALGQLVLLGAPSMAPNELDSLLATSQHIALANPQLAPYGRASKEALQRLELWKKNQDKFVFGENIGQATQFFVSGAAEMGFSAQSMAIGIKTKPAITPIPDSLYSPIRQGIVLIKSSPETEKKGEQFRNFLFSPEAQAILLKFGYKIPHESAHR